MMADNKNLKVLGTHFGMTGELNDNDSFGDLVQKTSGKGDNSLCLVEY